jgi:hypothetical protein
MHEDDDLAGCLGFDAATTRSTMNTDQLIRSLTGDLAPVSRRSIDLRMAIAVSAGVITTLMLVLLVIGVRADLGRALLTVPFWIKWAYAGLLCGLASVMMLRLARPGVKRLSVAWLVLPVGGLAVMAAIELARSPFSQWHTVWLGHSALYCSRRITLLSLPIFTGECIALRNLAPTHLRAAGATAALAAGACAAILYGLACDETSATFVLTWYSLGIGLATGAGALAGPSLLRW